MKFIYFCHIAVEEPAKNGDFRMTGKLNLVIGERGVSSFVL
jgi:hypothetical protein